MDARRTLIWLGVGVLGYTLWQKYKLREGLQFYFAGADFSGGALHIKISLDNPTGVAATLQNIDGYLFDGSYPISKVTYDTVQVIQPYARTLINLKFSPDLQGVILAAGRYLKNGYTNFQFKGTAIVDNLPVHIERDYKLN